MPGALPPSFFLTRSRAAIVASLADGHGSCPRGCTLGQLTPHWSCKQTFAGVALHCGVVLKIMPLHQNPQRGATPLSLTVGLLDAGSLNIPSIAPANFTFAMDSDDGSLLMIDGNLVISDPGAGCEGSSP